LLVFLSWKYMFQYVIYNKLQSTLNAYIMVIHVKISDSTSFEMLFNIILNSL